MTAPNENPNLTPGDKPYISPTQLEMWEKCGEQYRRRYILGEKIPPGLAMIRGSAVHSAAELNYRQKIESHEDLPLRTLQEAAATAFDERTAEGVSFDDYEQQMGPAVAMGRTKDVAVKLTGLFHGQVAPQVQPELVEERIRIPLPEHTHDLLGVVDVADVNKRVRDLKTSGRQKTQEDIDHSDQMNFYAVAYEHKTGSPPSELVLDTLVATKVPKLQTLRTRKTRRDREVLINRLNTMLAALHAGVYPPAPTSAWWCSAKWCGFWHTCPHVNSERRAAAEAMEV